MTSAIGLKTRVLSFSGILTTTGLIMPVRQICGISSRESSHVLMARPEIESVEQLEHILIPGGAASASQSERFITEVAPKFR